MSAPDDVSMERPRGLAVLVHAWVAVPQFVRALVPLAGMAILWWSSSRVPGDEPHSTARALFHNGMHVVAYGCLGASLWLAFSRRPVAQRHRWRSRCAWLIAAVYGVIDELHQSFVPGRVCSVADLFADASGAALAVVLLRGIAGVTSRWQRAASLFAVASLVSVAVATFASW